jgi:hypothetical protein
MGLRNPCTPNDRDLFVVATILSLESGEKALFWESAWLNAMRPKDIAPKIFIIIKKRKCSVKVALETRPYDSTYNPIHRVVGNACEAPDSIAWNLAKDGCYSASSAYKMQFLGQTTSMMPSMVWKPWAPSKCKIFTWLNTQNHEWKAYRLEKRGYKNCGC